MQTETSVNDGYVLNRTQEEYQRLNWQAMIWQEVAQRAMLKAGLKKGMRCLDAGCGTGAGMALMGEIVGAGAVVNGIDIDTGIGAYAENSLRQQGRVAYHFYEHDITSANTIPGGPYDFIYVRLLLIHMTRPEAILHKLFSLLNSGGILLVQDYDFNSFHASEKKIEKSVDYFRTLFCDLFLKSGKDPYVGGNFSFHFKKAGLHQPDGTDVGGIFTPFSQAVAMMKAVMASMLPAMEKLSLADENDYKQFCNELDDLCKEHAETKVMWPLLNAAWKVK